MGKVSIPDTLANVKSWEDLRRFVAITFANIAKEINGGLDFGANVSMAGPYTLTFSGSGVNMKIVHQLDKLPTGFLLVNADADIRLWVPSGFPWDSENAYLTASGAATVKVYIF